MHQRTLRYAETWCTPQYHCCGKRYLTREPAILHLLREHTPRGISIDAVRDAVASLHDNGPVEECVPCHERYSLDARDRAQDIYHRHDPYDPDPDTPPVLLPAERRLAAAVIRLALADACAPPRTMGTKGPHERARTRADALDWFLTPNDNLDIWCTLLGLNPWVVRDRVQQLTQETA